MKILVTGATGFIGKHLVQALLKKKHVVHTIVRATTDETTIPPQIKIHRHDGDTEHLVAYMEKERFDGVIHLASLFLPSHTTKDVTRLVDSNVHFSAQVLESATKSGVRWFINTGTFAQHYNNKQYSPVNLYASTKQAFIAIAEYYTSISPIVFTTVELFDTFGPHDTREKLMNLWLRTSMRGETLSMSPGKQKINLNYIDDVVGGFMTLVGHMAKKHRTRMRNKTYVIKSNKTLSLRDLAKVFEKVTRRTLNINWGGRPYRDREIMIPWTKGVRVPTWKQKVSLEEGIRQTIASLKQK